MGTTSSEQQQQQQQRRQHSTASSSAFTAPVPAPAPVANMTKSAAPFVPAMPIPEDEQMDVGEDFMQLWNEMSETFPEGGLTGLENWTTLPPDTMGFDPMGEGSSGWIGEPGMDTFMNSRKQM